MTPPPPLFFFSFSCVIYPRQRILGSFMWLDVFYENAGCKCLFFFFSFLLPLPFSPRFSGFIYVPVFFCFFLPSAIVL